MNRNASREKYIQTTAFCAALAILLALNFSAWAAPFELSIWPGVAPGSENATLVEKSEERPVRGDENAPPDHSLSGIVHPTITVHLPEGISAPCTAVLVIPGGGFTHLAIDKEGHDVARWLNSHGMAGVVLKYRMPDPECGLDVTNGAIKDMQRALRIMRLNAKEWHIAPDRIGTMGFSAGGYLTATSGVLFDDGNPGAKDPVDRQSCRPNFISPIYPLVSLTLHKEQSQQRIDRMLGPGASAERISLFSPNEQVKENAPPAFIAQAHDDGLPSKHSVLFYMGLRAAGVPAELHIYAKGGHGFGMRPQNLPVDTWRDRWLEWLKQQGF